MSLELINFRPTYRPLTDDEKSRAESIKNLAAQLDIEFAKLKALGYDARCIGFAKTNLECSVMWGIKGLTGEKNSSETPVG